MKRLLVADTHLTDKPADEYRWGLFDWLKIQVERYDIEVIDFLGDLTDSKEGHKAAFVNRLSSEIADLARIVPCNFLQGNHDYKLDQQPFFEFLNHIPNVRWISKILFIDRALYLPHSKNPAQEWKDIPAKLRKRKDVDYIFMHQCFLGSKSSMGFELDGADPNQLAKARIKMYAGDIHLPQTVGKVEYVGSPYPVHYGDRFLGRCIVTDSDYNRKVIHYPTIEKFTAVIDSPGELRELGLLEQDQVKVRYQLSSNDRDRWPEIKETIRSICYDMGVYLGGIELLSTANDKQRIIESRERANKLSPSEAVEVYALRENLSDDYITTAKELL